MRDGIAHDVKGLAFQVDELRRDLQNLEDCLRDGVTLPQIKLAFEVAAKHADRASALASGSAERIAEFLNRYARVA